MSGVVCRGEVVVTMLCCGVIVLWCDWSGLKGWGCGYHAVLWGYCAVV